MVVLICHNYAIFWGELGKRFCVYRLTLYFPIASWQRMAISSPIARDAVAAGLGNVQDMQRVSPRDEEKILHQLAVGGMACARTPAPPVTRSAVRISGTSLAASGKTLGGRMIAGFRNSTCKDT